MMLHLKGTRREVRITGVFVPQVQGGDLGLDHQHDFAAQQLRSRKQTNSSPPNFGTGLPLGTAGCFAPPDAGGGAGREGAPPRKADAGGRPGGGAGLVEAPRLGAAVVSQEVAPPYFAAFGLRELALAVLATSLAL